MPTDSIRLARIETQMEGHEKRDEDRFKEGDRRFNELKELCEEIKDTVKPVCEWVGQHKDDYVNLNTLWDERNQRTGAFSASRLVGGAVWAVIVLTLGWATK